ncbi:Hypothetical predicted protein [Mytilus galloprovincialis]|uniref:Mab-21-like HhH/H2TH-like domain-containing protein n=1 Tax=Mytilus galloprovincialis TaxID=29158 RepID=A0A8B6GIF6_MYTGA|nr:Hypothetical predicted protein [Mytilus galloprovincialis]
MCQNIVGTEEEVRTIRMMNNIRDNVVYSNITSGSFGEGIEMQGSDLDMMLVVPSIICEDKNFPSNPDKLCLSIKTEDTQPGYTTLRLVQMKNPKNDQYFEEIDGEFYLLNIPFKQPFSILQIVHGPCMSDKEGLHDVALCLHCKSWITPAMQWITRPNNSWPDNDVKASIVQHGTLFVPIGVKESKNEILEWRISFSVSEKFLIYTFKHTQLICYALIKILLKNVIAIDSENKDLLCSYFMKTILFWISEEVSPSIWRPENLLCNFMRCFRRLIYCVENSVCPHYFIPENNLFENKIKGNAQKMLLNKLNLINSYGWQCIFLSNQFFDIHVQVSHGLKDLNSQPIDTLEKLLCSKTLRRADSTMCLQTITLKHTLHLLLHIGSSNSKYLYLYYLSKYSHAKAQQIPSKKTSGNKSAYMQYKVSVRTLLLNMRHDAVSGWLMLASFFYGKKQYNLAIYILQYAVSKCSSETVQSFMKRSHIQHELFDLNVLRNMNIFQLWKILVADNFYFVENSTLLPDEIKIMIGSMESVKVSPANFADALTFLCHDHLNNTNRRFDSLECSLLS